MPITHLININIINKCKHMFDIYIVIHKIII